MSQPDSVGGSELKPGDARPKPLNQIHLTNTFHFYKCFRFQLFAEAISFWGEPINSYKFNAIPLQNRHLTKDGILCRLQQNIQNRVRTKIISKLNSFVYKTLLCKKKIYIVRMHVTEHTS